MNRLEREAERQRHRLLKLDAGHQRDLVRAYVRVTRRVMRHLAVLTAQIETERDAGRAPGVGWLLQQARYVQLLRDLRVELDTFSTGAVQVAVTAQRDLLNVVPQDALNLTLAALGPTPTGGKPVVAARFDRVNVAAFEQLVGNTATGTPLDQLFRDLSFDGVERVREVLEVGVATGQPVRTLTRDVTEAAGVPALRAMTIVRTESLRVYRQAALDTYRESGIVQDWIWYATRSERTCPVCLAMHGTAHALTEEFESHPNCRCTQIPRTRTWEELGFQVSDERPRVETGAELLRQMTEAERLAVLGRRRLDAYNAGRISLDDMVRATYSSRWGAGRRAATHTELGI